MFTSTAVCLPQPIIQTIGQTMNGEHSDICIRLTEFEMHSSMTQKGSLSRADFRLYSGLILLNFLYRSTMYMNLESLLEEPAQTNTLYQVQHLYKMYGFWTVK